MDQSNGVSERSLYRAVWRWHFIAGLLVLPFLLLLAITGGLYLFKDDLDRLVYRAWDDVPACSIAGAPATLLVSRVQETTGGKVLQMTQPERSNESVRMIVRMPD